MAVYGNPHKALYGIASCTERCEYRYMRYGLIIAGGGKIFRPRLGCQCKKPPQAVVFLWGKAVALFVVAHLHRGVDVVAAIDVGDFAGDAGGEVGAEEGGGVAYFFDSHAAFERRGFFKAFEHFA